MAAAVVLLLVAQVGILSAQQVFGNIYGTVTDKSGGAVANAKVTITDVNKNTRFQVTTNESGNYTKGQLIPGIYRVQIEAPGFENVVSNNLQVSVDQSARFDVALNVGNVTEQVQVTAAAPLLQTDRADVAQTFTSKQLQDLPNFGRNLQTFMLLNPGTSQFGWNQNNAEDPQGGKQIQVNGQAFSGTGFELDGTTNQDPILGEILINPPMDAVNEVKQASQDYDAEFGYTSGGIMTYSTKSGSNAFHGSAFEYIYLNTPGFQDFARNPFNSAEDHGDAHRPLESIWRLYRWARDSKQAILFWRCAVNAPNARVVRPDDGADRRRANRKFERVSNYNLRSEHGRCRRPESNCVPEQYDSERPAQPSSACSSKLFPATEHRGTEQRRELPEQLCHDRSSDI
jgi:hypothetical protein